MGTDYHGWFYLCFIRVDPWLKVLNLILGITTEVTEARSFI